MSGSTSQIQVTISAVDKATKVILGVNKSISLLRKDQVKFEKALKEFKNVSGIAEVGKRFQSLGKGVGGVGGKLARVTERMAGFVGVSSIAAIAAVTVEWGRLGFQVQRTSNMLMVSAGSFQNMRGAALGFGLSADSAGNSLKSMGDTIEDAINGRNQGALVLMNRLGISLESLTTRIPNAKKGFEDLRKAMQSPGFKGNRYAQAFAARMFGQEEYLPLLLASDAEYKKLINQSISTGYTQSDDAIERASKFSLALYGAEVAAKGLGHTIGDALIPVVQPLLELFTQWEIKNKDIVSSGIIGFIQKLTGDFGALKAALQQVGDVMGASTLGWLLAPLGASVAVPAAALALGGAEAYQAGGRARAANSMSGADMAKTLMGLGWSDVAAAGIAGNALAESGGNPLATGPGNHIGLFQWSTDRQVGINKFLKENFGTTLNTATPEQQLAAENWELHSGSDAGTLAAGRVLPGMKSAANAALAFDNLAERPGSADPSASKRSGAADKILIEVRVHNAPHGATVNSDQAKVVNSGPGQGLQ